MTKRPVLYVLAGVNGAGKSSIGGYLLELEGLTWFDPDAFARELVAATGCGQTSANAAAWHEGMRRVKEAMAGGADHAFETTLGGNTVPRTILEATLTHDVAIWYCGLDSPERHIARVKARVAAGGHDIPEQTIRQRYLCALTNLIELVPHAAEVQVYDNSQDAPPGESVQDPVLVAHIVQGQLVWPDSVDGFAATPDWAKPLLEAVLQEGK